MVIGYRGRFAPSPTGHLHLGLLRTALLGWLRARSLGGRFVLRVEDLDGPRVVPGAAEAILEQLRWAGLDWDEGPDTGGPAGPYVQSERLARYEAAIESLQARGLVYPCTCTRREISLQSAPHGPIELGPAYPGTCRAGPRRPGAPASLRFRLPEALPAFVDGVHGLVPAPDPAPGDFVVRRADGLFSYQLAVVVDDIAMEVSEVVRGDDLVSSTPLQLALYDALGAPRPAFAHVPLLRGADGERMAKRHRSATVAWLRDQGVRAEDLLGALAHSAGLLERPKPVRAAQLIGEFSLERLSREPAQLAPETLLQAR